MIESSRGGPPRAGVTESTVGAPASGGAAGTAGALLPGGTSAMRLFPHPLEDQHLPAFAVEREPVP